MYTLFYPIWFISGCSYGGKDYYDGQKFNLGCKECTCDWGKVSCDDKNCGSKYGHRYVLYMVSIRI